MHFVIIAKTLRSSALELPEAALTTLRGMKHEATKELLGAPSSDDEERPSKSKWDKVRVLNVESKKSDTVSSPGRSFVRSLSDSFVRPEVAASAHTSYDAEEWVATMKASFDTVGAFVIQPWLLLTGLTALLTVLSFAYDKPPWWTTLPPFAHTVLGGALSFLMVFRTNTAYSRWWEARLMWGQITVTSRSVGTQVFSMMKDPPQLLSLLILFPIVVKNGLRDEPTPSSEIATAEELVSASSPSFAASLTALATGPSPPNAVVEAMAKAIRKGLAQPEGDTPGLAASAYMHLSSDLRSLTQAATACERIKTSPMPLGYVSALRFFLLFWLTTLPLTLIGSYGIAATPAVSVIAFLFLNLENVAMEIEQPFVRPPHRSSTRPARGLAPLACTNLPGLC